MDYTWQELKTFCANYYTAPLIWTLIRRHVSEPPLEVEYEGGSFIMRFKNHSFFMHAAPDYLEFYVRRKPSLEKLFNKTYYCTPPFNPLKLADQALIWYEECLELVRWDCVMKGLA